MFFIDSYDNNLVLCLIHNIPKRIIYLCSHLFDDSTENFLRIWQLKCGSKRYLADCLYIAVVGKVFEL